MLSTSGGLRKQLALPGLRSGLFLFLTPHGYRIHCLHSARTRPSRAPKRVPTAPESLGMRRLASSVSQMHSAPGVPSPELPFLLPYAPEILFLHGAALLLAPALC